MYDCNHQAEPTEITAYIRDESVAQNSPAAVKPLTSAWASWPAPMKPTLILPATGNGGRKFLISTSSNCVELYWQTSPYFRKHAAAHILGHTTSTDTELKKYKSWRERGGNSPWVNVNSSQEHCRNFFGPLSTCLKALLYLRRGT